MGSFSHEDIRYLTQRLNVIKEKKSEIHEIFSLLRELAEKESKKRFIATDEEIFRIPIRRKPDETDPKFFLRVIGSHHSISFEFCSADCNENKTWSAEESLFILENDEDVIPNHWVMPIHSALPQLLTAFCRVFLESEEEIDTLIVEARDNGYAIGEM